MVVEEKKGGLFGLPLKAVPREGEALVEGL